MFDSDGGYQAKAKRSSEIAVYKNYGKLFSPARNATHSAAGGSQIVESYETRPEARRISKQTVDKRSQRRGAGKNQ
jgi:hypothetical protein